MPFSVTSGRRSTWCGSRKETGVAVSSAMVSSAYVAVLLTNVDLLGGLGRCGFRGGTGLRLEGIKRGRGYKQRVASEVLDKALAFDLMASSATQGTSSVLCIKMVQAFKSETRDTLTWSMY